MASRKAGESERRGDEPPSARRTAKLSLPTARGRATRARSRRTACRVAWGACRIAAGRAASAPAAPPHEQHRQDQETLPVPSTARLRPALRSRGASGRQVDVPRRHRFGRLILERQAPETLDPPCACGGRRSGRFPGTRRSLGITCGHNRRQQSERIQRLEQLKMKTGLTDFKG